MGDAPLRELTEHRDIDRRSRPWSLQKGDDGASRLRNRKAMVSLDDQEHAELAAAAAAERMPLSTWLRVAALRVARAAGAGLSPAAPGTKPSAAARTLPLPFGIDDEIDPTTCVDCRHPECDAIDCEACPVCIGDTLRDPAATAALVAIAKQQRSSSPTTSTSRTKPTKAPARSRRPKAGGRKSKATSGPRRKSKR